MGDFLNKFFENPTEMIWVIFGFIAQAAFAARFIVQWLASEKAGKSTVPVAFWYLSLLGGGMLFAYAIYRKDPVFIVGQGSGFFIYLRNLYFIWKEKKDSITKTNLS